ncbi:MAG: Ig-like domain-containing protein [Pirellulales bacterium]
MGRHRSRAWGKNQTNGKATRRTARVFQTRRLQVEVLEARWLLSFGWALAWDGSDDIGLSAEAGMLTASPVTPDLLDASDSGVSSTDNLTKFDNSAPGNTLRFSVGGTVAGATVTLYADGVAIGSAVAEGATTLVTTNGSLDLADGNHAITAQQALPGEEESADSPALSVTIDTVAPVFMNLVRLGGYDTSGNAEDVAVSGTFAYVADGSAGLQILDVSDPAAPVRLGGYDTSGIAYEVAVSGTLAYVADASAGLVILDVTNPAAPVLFGTFVTGGSANGVTVVGTRAYVADGFAGLQILDVSNPAAPVKLGGYDTAEYAHGVVVSGTLAYVADGRAGLQILDVTNPAAPVRLGTFNTSGFARDVAVSGTVAYVADDDAGLQVIDVTNPAAPVRLGEFDTRGVANCVAVSGKLAYVGDFGAGIQILDVSNPAAPLRLGTLGGGDRGVAVVGTLAYATAYYTGLVIADVGLPGVPPPPDLQPASDTGISNADDITGDNTPTFDVSVQAGYYYRVYRDGVQVSGNYENSASYTTAVQPDGTYGYSVAAVDAAGNLSASSAVLSVTIDTSITSAPDLLGVSDTGVSTTDNITNLDNGQPEKALQFAVGKTIAGATVTLYADGVAIGSAVAEGTTTLVTTSGSLDLADGKHAITARQTLPGEEESADSPARGVTIDTVAPVFMNPVRLGKYDTSGNAEDVAVSGTFAYVADGSAGLQILDVSDPAAPVRLGAYDTLDARDVAVFGTLAYVADGTAGLQILDVTNPAAPVRLGGYDTAGAALGVTVVGTLAYVADGEAGLVVLDVTDPANPVQLGTFDTSGTALSVTISGTLAYVADGIAGLVILDVTDPATPVRLGTLDASDSTLGVAVSGTLAYVADNRAGLQIVDVTNPAAPVRLRAYTTGGDAHAVAVSGTWAYVTEYRTGLGPGGDYRSGGLYVLDVSNPSIPVRWGSSYYTNGSALDLGLSEGLVYVAQGAAGLQIIDLDGAPDLTADSDTGISNADNITADNTPTFAFSLPSGFYFRLYRDGVQISRDYEQNSYTAAVQPDGTYSFAAVIVDAAGNVSPSSQTMSVTVDTMIPSAPDLRAVSDSGASTTDNLTNLDNGQPDKVLQFTVGNTVAGARVTLYADGLAIGSAVATGTTTTVTTNGAYDLADGMHAITARQTPSGQSASRESAAVNVTIDTAPPERPLAPDLQPGSDTGISSTDNITSDTTPTFDLSAPFGLYFLVYRDGVQISSAPRPSPYTAPGQSEGTYGYAAAAVDAAGNVSALSEALFVTIDTSIPPAPNLAAVSDTGVSHGDALTNLDNSQSDRTLQFAVGDTIAGATVTLYADGVAIGSAVSTGGTATVTTNGSLDLADGPHAITALQTRAGQSEGRESAALNITIDTTPPEPPPAPDLQPGSDTGASDSDNVTADATPTFDVSVPAGLYYRVYRDGGQISGDFETSPYTARSQPGGTYDYAVAAVDVAGNISALSEALKVTIDTLVLPVPDLLAVSDTGVSSTDDLTNLDNSQGDKTLQFLVVGAISGATITLYADGVAIGSAVATGATTTVTTNGGFDLVDGTHAFTARQTPVGQSESRESAALIVTFDTIAPAPSSAPDLQPGSDTGASDSDDVTADGTPTFDVWVPAGSYFRVYRDGVQISGDWETSPYTAPLQPDGTYGYAVAAVDAAGNVSSLSPALSVTIITRIPSAPELLAVSDTGVSDTDNLTNLDNSRPEKSLQFTVGKTVAGATVTLYADGKPVGIAVAEGVTTTVTTNGSFHLADGICTITARQTVPGEAQSLDSAELTVTIDATAPAAPLPPDLEADSDTGISETDNITSDTTPTFDLSAPPESYLRVYRDGVQVSGDYETGPYTAAPQAAGTYGFAVAVVDAAGNVSALSSPLLVTVDTAMPSAPDLLPASDAGVSSTDNLTNLDNSRPDKTLRFAVGNTVAGATVTVYADGFAIGSAVANGATTIVTTRGDRDLADGTHAITARQTLPGRPESAESAALEVTLDTVPNIIAPLWPGGYNIDFHAVYDVTCSGTLAYLAAGDSGLQILDVTDPVAPVWLGGYDTSGQAYDVAVSGTAAYVADGTSGLVILDVTNPAAPVRLGGYKTPGWSHAVAVSGARAYVADGKAGLVIIDVTNPAAPVPLGRYDTSGGAYDVELAGTLAYVADYSAGLVIIDVSDPAAPLRLGGYDTDGYSASVAVSGTLAYVADGDAGLVIIDVSNPAAPARLGGYDTSGNASDVVLSGTLAYVADGVEGLVIIDVSDSAACVRDGAFDTSRLARGVAIAGTTAYVADENGGLVIVDVSPQELPWPPDLQPTSDTGISSTDNITRYNTPAFQLFVPSGSYFRLYRDGVQISGDCEIGITFVAGDLPDGTYDFTVATVDAAGNVSEQSPPLAVTIDTRPPAIKNLLVGGTNWTGDFLAELAAEGSQNAGGYSIPVGSGSQLAPLPWANINQIKIVFNENASVDKGDLVLSGAATGQYDIAGSTFSYDPATFTATWILPSALSADRFELRLDADGPGAVADVAGNRLDGEWSNPASPADTGTDTYPSGNGAAGGDFVFRFAAMPCDTNRDGAIDIFDVAHVLLHYGRDHGMTPEQGDFNGDGRTDIFDVALLQVAYGRALDSPALAPASVAGEGQAAWPLVAAQPGHSPIQLREVAESFDGRVSGPTAPSMRPAAAAGASASWASVAGRHARRHGAHAANRPMQPVAVHHAAENASWESALDRVLESDGKAWEWPA